MNTIRSAIPLVLLAATAGGAALFLSAAPTSEPVPATEPARWVRADLDDSMQTLQAGVKSLDKSLEKQETDKSLATVREMQKAAHEAKLHEPPKAKEIADAQEKAAMLKGFRLKLIDLERALLDVEAALVEGKPEDAKKALDTRVKPIKKEGHDTYKD